MGYECPVCSTPQADARHLANHMAMTAMLGREDHADWLDEHTVGGLAESEDPEDPLEERGGALFDDGHDHGHGPNEGIDVENLDPEARAAIEEAREMTEAMLRDEREQEETDDTDEDEEPAADDGDSEGD